MKFKNAYISIINGVFNLCLPIEKDSVNQTKRFIDDMDKKKVYVANFKVFRNQRSTNANAYFHCLVNKIADKLNKGNDEVKRKLVLEYGTVERDNEGKIAGCMLPLNYPHLQIYPYMKWYGTKNISDKTYDLYMFYKHTHLMDSGEMARLIDGVITEAKELGIETATPEEIAKMKARWGENEQKK